MLALILLALPLAWAADPLSNSSWQRLADSPNKVEITMLDGTVYVGSIDEVETDKITVELCTGPA
jgi:hypothetical protein